MTTARHLASEEVAAYLDKALTDAECARVESHLADCDECRQEIVEASSLLERAPRSRRWLMTAPAIAAAVLVLFVGRASFDTEPSPGGRLRATDTPSASEGVSAVRAIAPIGRQRMGGGTVFVWRPASPGALYRFTLTDDRGDRIWSGSTSDTTLAVPVDAGIGTGRSYHWYVDAVQPDGSSATSGIISFQVAP